MITVVYKNQYEYSTRQPWRTWISLGQFYTVQDAIKEIENEKYVLIQMSDILCQGTYVDCYVKSISFFKFFDDELNDYVSIESPWKIGLIQR